MINILSDRKIAFQNVCVITLSVFKRKEILIRIRYWR